MYKSETVSHQIRTSKKSDIIVRLCVFLIKIYQLFLSPLKPRYCHCRFMPTCSQYAKEAFLLHGPLKGAMLTGKRILRCHPWSVGGHDPVPQKQFQTTNSKK